MGDMKKQENLILWNLFLEGDEKAYARIYELYAQEMYAYGFLFTSNEELIKDCLHDVFIKIYNNRKNLSPVDNIKLYLFMAMKNQLFDIFCKPKELYHNETMEPVFSIDFTVEEMMIHNEEEEFLSIKMQQMMDSLTPRQKEVLYYKYVENLSYDEIGEIMQMNYQSILNLVQRSLKKLRTSFSRSSIYLPMYLIFLLVRAYLRI